VKLILELWSLIIGVGIPGVKLLAVVKADAYGHGAIPVSRDWKN
jgi:alanine racemase